MSTTSKLLKRFEQACKDADSYNAKTKTKRFHPMAHTSHARITEIGVYDAKTKKYALTDVRAYNAMEIMDQIENMVNYP